MEEHDQNTKVASVFNSFAVQYAARYMNVDRYAMGLDRFVHELSLKTPKILDIGCGPGNVARYILNQIPGALLTGIDLSEEMLVIARKSCPEANFISLDANQLPFKKNSFDGVICSFCLPYLDQYRAKDLIDHCHHILKPGGCLYVSTIEGDYARSGPQTSSSGEGPVVNMYFYNESWLHNEAQKTGFIKTYTEIISYTDHRSKPVSDLIGLYTKAP